VRFSYCLLIRKSRPRTRRTSTLKADPCIAELPHVDGATAQTRLPGSHFGDLATATCAQGFGNDFDGVDGSQLARAYKLRTFAVLAPRTSERVLDIGCGTGEDTIALASLVGSHGEVVGIDSNQVAIGEAHRRACGIAPVAFR